MNKKKIISYILTSLVCVSLFVGCGQANKVTTLSDSEKTKVLNDIKLFKVDATHPLSDMESTISKNIGAFDEKDKDEIVSQYISQMYTNSSDLDKKLSTIGFELEDVLKKDETIKVTDEKTWSKIPATNATVKGFLEETKAEGFTLEKNADTSNYKLSVDNKKIIDKYGKDMSASLKQYLELNVYEETAPSLGDQEKKTVDLDEVAKRIIMVEKGLETDASQNHAHIDKWMSSSDYYYYILLGLSHDFFVTSDYLNDDILSKYKELAEKNSGTKLAEILNKVVDIYTASNRKVDTDVTAKIEKAVTDSLYTQDIQQILTAKMKAQQNDSIADGTDATNTSNIDSQIIPSDAVTEVDNSSSSATADSAK